MYFTRLQRPFYPDSTSPHSDNFVAAPPDYQLLSLTEAGEDMMDQVVGPYTADSEVRSMDFTFYS